ncbi:MAG: ABC transporter ATP-binding protein [Gammaproteobacteria bacterium]|jgi:simple sugar transport system ATP-binding protein|nr:ABC transporter ATP-binding protein [Gammaproteobacteria bacterium]
MSSSTLTEAAPSSKGSAQALLAVKSVSKKFGDFVANDAIDLSLEAGKIHALLGENGAGKSTLVKMIYGALQPTSGQIIWQGEALCIDNPAAARELGIGMVFQHFSLFEALTVTENISLALPPHLRTSDLEERIASLSQDYGLPLNPQALVVDLSVGERQRIEIVRCLLQEPRLLIMDEPTAVLTPQEAEALFATLNRLTTEGCAVLYISHRLEEVKQLCHDATILRHGKVVAQLDPQLETAATLAQHMVGTSVHEVSRQECEQSGEVALQLSNLKQMADTPFGVHLLDINLQVRSGEIMAIAGVAGNGQGELFSVLSGEVINDVAGAISIQGEACGQMGINARRQLHAAFVPEERNGHGAVADFSLTENILLSRHAVADGQQPLHKGWAGIDRAELASVNQSVAKKYDVRSASIDAEAGSLSGGNLQKFVVGRELERQPKVLVINQPTWGVDAGAAALIRQALIDLSRQGSAILVISQDLDEIFELADRIAVISRGHLSASHFASEMTREDIGLLMSKEETSHPVSSLSEGGA